MDSFSTSIRRIAAQYFFPDPQPGGIHNLPDPNAKIVGILGYDSDDDLALLEDGSRHPELYFILIDRDQMSIDAQGLVVRFGLVYQDGRLFFVECLPGFRIDYLVNYNEAPLHGKTLNLPVAVQSWAQDYFWNKDLTSDILRRAGLLVPRDISLVLMRPLAGSSEDILNKSQNPRVDARRATIPNVVALNRESLTSRRRPGFLQAFLAKHECDLGVFKPNRGGQGVDVHFFEARNLAEKEMEVLTLLRKGVDVVIQERIVPPLVMKGTQRLDWNLRVFVTRDREGRAIAQEMIVRIGEAGAPVNRSEGAEILLLEEVAQLLDWDRLTLQHVREQVLQVSARAYVVLCNAIAHDAASGSEASAPDILGLDVIVRQQEDRWQVYIIEMDINPGGACDLNQRLRIVSRAHHGIGDLSKESLDARVGGANYAWIRLICDRCNA
ncbi:MAG: hypothetical protein ACREC0_09105 [Methylocella sp.]